MLKLFYRSRYEFDRDEFQIQKNGSMNEIYSSYRRQYHFSLKLQSQYIRTTIGRVIMNKKIQETIKE